MKIKPIVLEYVKKKLNINDCWQICEGVKFYVDYINPFASTLSILVLCPKCGNLGILTKNGKELKIEHERSHKYCLFGQLSEHYPTLLKIYRTVREAEGEIKLKIAEGRV